MLQTLGFFVGGRAEISEISVDLLTVRCGGRETSSSSKIEGVPARLVLLGTVGSGHVKSWSPSGQNGRIFSNRYHCRSVDKPFGAITDDDAAAKHP